MLNFTIQPNETFNHSVLEEFCESHELFAQMNSNNTITLYSLVLDEVDEAYEQLENLVVSTDD
tara:strand:+ start:1259 stop:1447 length:189 start_codon:yes stop_codon:yes gene_type:complete